MTDVNAMVKALLQERDMLDEVIVTLEALVRGKGRRRGRPPRWLREAREDRSRRPRTAGRRRKSVEP